MSINRIIIGNLTADPELVQAGQKPIAKLRIAENSGERRDGKWEPRDDATFHNIEADFELARNAASSLRKGDAVIVIGEEYTEGWDDKDTGERRTRRIVKADRIGADIHRATVTIARNARDGE